MTERPCYGCGRYVDESQMEAIDVTRDGEYYPSFIHVCYSCNSQSQGAGGRHD